MGSKKSRLLTLICCCFFFFTVLISGQDEIQGTGAGRHRPHRHRHRHHLMRHRVKGGCWPTKLFVFGDSYADTGNNKKQEKSWKPPYGTSFPGKPAGRFSDGRVLTDFLAKHMGVKSPPAYEHREYQETNMKKHGVNLAYGGTGVFEVTPAHYPNMSSQVDLLEHLVRNQSFYSLSDLNQSLALVTLVGNDYSPHLTLSPMEFISLINNVTTELARNIKRIHSLGINKIAVTTLQPLQCLPLITAPSSYTKCNSTITNLVLYHNSKLHQIATSLNPIAQHPAFHVLDLYESFMSVIEPGVSVANNGRFTKPKRPCCDGVGRGVGCGEVDEKGMKKYRVCEDPRGAFFWDYVHPTQEGWRVVFQKLKPALDKFFG